MTGRYNIMVDKAHFHLEATLISRSVAFGGSENSKMIIEKPLYPQRATVWCDFWAKGSLSLIFFRIKL